MLLLIHSNLVGIKMNITTKTQYGLRAVINLAHSSNNKPKPLSKIAKEENISFSYLEQIFAELKRKKIVKGIRGVSGGYKLSHNPQELTVKQVVTALEDPVSGISCINGNCTREHSCKAKLVWEKVNNAIENTLENLTLANLL